MSLLGTRLASDILPQPLKNDVDAAVNQTLTTNSSEFFDTAMIESLLCVSGIKASIEPEIFKTIFDAWRLKQMLLLSYKSPNSEAVEHRFEPHIIAFHKGVWYIKGYDHGTKNVRVYAIQRIVSAEFGGDNFETDKKLLDLTRKNGLFNYSKIEGILLHCDASIAFYLNEHQKIKQFKIEPQPDGSLIIKLKPAIEHEVIRWILGEGGKIRVIEPVSLREKIATAAKRILENNS
jgi:predicted DNA-binding transcriptional regulator YafY